MYQDGYNGVALIMNKTLSNALIKAESIGSRIIIAWYCTKPVNTTIIECYIPTSAEEDEAVEGTCN